MGPRHGSGQPRRPPSSPYHICRPAWLFPVHGLTRFNVDTVFRLKVPFCGNERRSCPLRMGSFSRH
jgi:hypothetical protein